MGMDRREVEIVRCVACRHEYEAPQRGEEMACPNCGSRSWISARIPDEPVRPAKS
jgi:DNA-directed RNA polymerase subunit RPC12/RpoP